MKILRDTHRPGAGNFRKTRFTLIELVCVLAIAMLLIGLVAGRVGKKPVFITFKGCITEIEGLMNKAAQYAEINGEKVVISYEDRKFFPLGNMEDEVFLNFYNYIKYEVPPDIDIRFEKQEDEVPEYVFYPDGSATGLDILLEERGHIAEIKISKLSGVPVIMTND